MALLHLALVFQTCVYVLVQADDYFDPSTCGSEKSCMKRPPDCSVGDSEKKCDLLFSSKFLDGDRVEFEVWVPSKLSSGANVGYMAVGLSEDTQMGKDAVTYCYTIPDGNTGIHVGATEGKQFFPSEQAVESVELEDIRTDNDHFYCKFTQKLNNGSTDILNPDLTKPYHILIVRGTTGLDHKSLNIHAFGPNEGPFVSDIKNLAVSSKPSLGASPSAPFDSSSENISDSQEKNKTLRRIHGALMLLAWFGCVFSAVYSARHLREHWPDTTIQGLHIWFHIHRLLNSLGVILIIVSIILVSVSTGFEWTGPTIAKDSTSNTTGTAIHSLIGTIAVLLAFFQPIMAFMRCDKQHSMRPVFNVAHRSAGLSAIILAVITLGYAFFSPDFGRVWKQPTHSWIIFIIFVVFAIVILVVQEVLRVRENKAHHRIGAIEMRARTPAPSDSYYYNKNRKSYSPGYRNITSTLFIIFGGVSFTVAVVLAYLVLSNPA